MRQIVEQAESEVMSLLEENRDKLDSLVAALLEHETLDEEDAYAAAGVSRTPAAPSKPYATAAQTRLQD